MGGHAWFEAMGKVRDSWWYPHGHMATLPHGGLTESSAPARIEGHGRLHRLDGLRGLAVIMVITQHSDVISHLGWVGVHLFFVLSGFLITGILRRSRDQSSFWGQFYIKRVTRILPPLIPFFIFCAWTISIPWKTVGLAYIFFGANIVQSFRSTPVTHLTILWSLTVEEHFYLLWPFAIRYMRLRHLVMMLSAILVLDPVARAIATPYTWSWMPIYFLTCFQLDGLAAGALIALLAEHRVWRDRLLRRSGWLAVASAFTFALLSRNAEFLRERNSIYFNSFGYSLIVLMFAFSLAYVFLKPHSNVSRILASRPLVFIGSISYGLYLYGGVIILYVQRFGRVHPAHPGRWTYMMVAMGFVVACIVSWISFYFYESPIVRWGRRKAAAMRRAAGKAS
jgi:peptidoglycan/LPS O-acetylase OafA/YrhL